MNETLQKKSPEKKLIFFAKLSFSFFTPQRVKTKNGFWIHDVGNRTNIMYNYNLEKETFSWNRNFKSVIDTINCNRGKL